MFKATGPCNSECSGNGYCANGLFGSYCLCNYPFYGSNCQDSRFVHYLATAPLMANWGNNLFQSYFVNSLPTSLRSRCGCGPGNKLPETWYLLLENTDTGSCSVDVNIYLKDGKKTFLSYFSKNFPFKKKNYK